MLFYFHKKILHKISIGLKSNGGRNLLGRVCIRGRGRGSKRLFLRIDTFRKACSFCRILYYMYDSRRSATVGGVLYLNGLFSYILLTQNNSYIGAELYSGLPALKFDKAIQEGWSMPIYSFPLFSQLCNLEIKTGKGFSVSRAAGNSSLFISKTKNFACLKLRSGWQIFLNLNLFAVKGAISNPNHQYSKLNSAGSARAKGFRSKVRGVAKNPCDHPHGGGMEKNLNL